MREYARLRRDEIANEGTEARRHILGTYMARSRIRSTQREARGGRPHDRHVCLMYSDTGFPKGSHRNFHRIVAYVLNQENPCSKLRYLT